MNLFISEATIHIIEIGMRLELYVHKACLSSLRVIYQICLNSDYEINEMSANFASVYFFNSDVCDTH